MPRSQQLLEKGKTMKNMSATTRTGRMNNKQMLPRVVYSLIALVAVGSAQVQAGAIAINWFGYGYSAAGTRIWTPFGPNPTDMSDGRSDGPRHGPTGAWRSLTHPVTGLHVDASAWTWGNWGAAVSVHTFGINWSPFSIGLADLLEPFVDPVQPEPNEPADADLRYDGSVHGNVLFLRGEGKTNVNGSLELGVVDLGTMEPEEFARILTDAGSLEKAVAQGTFPEEQVLARYRQHELAGAFRKRVDLGDVPPDRVAVSGLAHGVTLSSGGDD
jgi:hypothetical protein